MKQLFFVMAAARQKDFSPSLVNEYGALSLFSNDSLFVCKKDKQPVGKGRTHLDLAFYITQRDYKKKRLHQTDKKLIT